MGMPRSVVFEDEFHRVLRERVRRSREKKRMKYLGVVFFNEVKGRGWGGFGELN